MKKQIVLVLSDKKDFLTWCGSILSDCEVFSASFMGVEPSSALALIVDYDAYEDVVLLSVYSYFQEKNHVRCIFVGNDIGVSVVERKSRFPKAKFFTPSQSQQISRLVQVECMLAESLSDDSESRVRNLDSSGLLSRDGNPSFLFSKSGLENCDRMSITRDLMDVASASDVNVLLLGETGVGKTCAARKIHESSGRSGKNFVEINVPNHIGRLESDLFGTVRGAFTEAQNSDGLLKEAEGGTVFFDEIGELPLEDQTRLLSLIETKSFRKMGSGKIEKFDARMIFATNQDLRTLVRQHRFRADLYYRINTIIIEVPPLKSHSEDIPKIAGDFAAGWNKVISESALMKLCSYPWPGNIRELKNCMERSCLICRNKILEASDILLDAFF
ncbi:MAG: sigma 54-interacting transcriptional regulator [Treponema sp.]|nr:sigma-54-dependent Fis family transcriptional regulator [Treponema sp.]MEE3313766.1 sigma 54-interacting transcriptional regulator [Treponema sp.]